MIFLLKIAGWLWLVLVIISPCFINMEKLQEKERELLDEGSL